MDRRIRPDKAHAPVHTYYNMREQDFGQKISFVQGRARTSVDFASASDEDRRGIKIFNNEEHLRTDHAGLLLEIKTAWWGNGLRAKPFKMMVIPRENSPKALEYREKIEERVGTWMLEADLRRSSWTGYYV